jgi:hypothetical protein
MPLINCPECGAQVSDKAVSCPSCGHPMNAVAGGGLLKTFGWMSIAIIALIVALFALLNTCNWKPVI